MGVILLGSFSRKEALYIREKPDLVIPEMSSNLELLIYLYGFV